MQCTFKQRCHFNLIFDSIHSQCRYQVFSSTVLEMLELINLRSTFVDSSYYSDSCLIACHHQLCQQHCEHLEDMMKSIK